MKRLMIPIVICIAIALISMVGCNKKGLVNVEKLIDRLADIKIEEATGADIDISSNAVDITGVATEVSRNEVKGIEAEVIVEQPTININEVFPKKVTTKVTETKKELKPNGTTTYIETVTETIKEPDLKGGWIILIILIIIGGLVLYLNMKKEKKNG